MVRGIARERKHFLLSNLLKGFIYLAILLVLFLLLKQFSSEEQRYNWFGAIYDDTALIMFIFVVSELLFGIIPPEVFMLWSLETSLIGPYFFSIGVLSVISYAAGFFNFNLGRWAKDKKWIRRLGYPRFNKYLRMFRQYGGYLVIVASISPLPFSAISLLSGIGGLPLRKYLFLSLFRIVRYFAYGIALMGLDQL
ncbi:SNARE associated Golgi protein [Cyclobacterium lianum]|uniref:SNARE associated Golgi protein n=1 Tax=Cyclobacterium lianum TaxID=388280 RepID=A0A1M7I1D6_9BACT|nr:VTT domain-containing protein [Cyclobacterium lianum]SHM34606.1 SNARE associated Golgi protein [Cyclobacterium lianum]